MKAVIFAGGLGTRFSERTQYLPKPMIEIGGKPILWHIMKTYSHYGINDFIICCGYKHYVIKEYFLNYFLFNSDLTVDLANNSVELHDQHSEKWRVSLVDTGLYTMTAGRLRRIRHLLGDDTFCLTYGDGVADVDIAHTIEQHRRDGKAMTITVTPPKGKFGVVKIDHASDTVTSFREKPSDDDDWINAGYMVCEPSIFDFIPDDADQVMLEAEPLEAIVRAGQMSAYKHMGFWKPMDMLKDNIELEKLWESGQAPWKVWE